jgi:peptidoglycan hydrolase-like protein with peptidoglycan-binding domain
MSFDQKQCKPGMMGEAITSLHRRLAMRGIEVDANDVREDRFGHATEAALRQFQSMHGLPVHGVVDDA